LPQAPIELQAHDCVRYIGDMLAWVHQTTATESLLVTNLFGGLLNDVKKVENSVSEVISEGDSSGGEEEVVVVSAGEILGEVMAGIARPLRVRIMQVIDYVSIALIRVDFNGTTKTLIYLTYQNLDLICIENNGFSIRLEHIEH
jgi:hypothetical protein